MKTQKMMKTLLLLSILLFNSCSKDEIKSEEQYILGSWVMNEIQYGFLFNYEQGFELLEDNSYHPIHLDIPNSGDTTITKEVFANLNWNLNKAKDSITFSMNVPEPISASDAISFRIVKLSHDSLLLYGKPYANPGSEPEETLFLKVTL